MPVSQEALEKRIRTVYTQAQKDLQKKLDDYIAQFRKKDAQMRQDLAEEAITQKEYDEWRQGAIFRGKAWRARLKQVTDTLADANDESLRLVRGEQLDEFAEGMNHEQYVLAQNTGLSINFGLYDADTVGRLIKEQPDLLPPKKLNRRKDETWNRKKVTSSILQGIIQGESIDDIARRIARDTAQKNGKAMIRYARTATTSAQNAGRMETMHRAHGMGINIRKQWLATLDHRTRDSHQRLDGKEAGVDEPFKSEFGDIMFPGDPHADPADVYNCRCTLIYVYPDYPTSPGERRDNVTGEHVRGDMTYNEWARTQLPAVQTKSHANRQGKDIAETKDIRWTKEEYEKARLERDSIFAADKAEIERWENEEKEKLLDKYGGPFIRQRIEVRTNESLTDKEKEQKLAELKEKENEYKEKRGEISERVNERFEKALDKYDSVFDPEYEYTKIKGRLTERENAKAVNPNYSKDLEYTVNCQRCAVAYEMREQGYDVEALRAPEAGAGADFVIKSIFKNAEEIEEYGTGHANTIRAIEALKEWGPGARAIVSIQRGGNAGGHVYNMKNDGTKIWFIDSQLGAAWNDSDFGNETDGGAIEDAVFFRLIRTDNVDKIHSIPDDWIRSRK